MYGNDYEIIKPEIYNPKIYNPDPLKETFGIVDATKKFNIFNNENYQNINKPLFIGIFLILMIYIFEKTFGRKIEIFYITGMIIILFLLILVVVIFLI